MRPDPVKTTAPKPAAPQAAKAPAAATATSAKTPRNEAALPKQQNSNPQKASANITRLPNGASLVGGPDKIKVEGQFPDNKNAYKIKAGGREYGVISEVKVRGEGEKNTKVRETIIANKIEKPNSYTEKVHTFVRNLQNTGNSGNAQPRAQAGSPPSPSQAPSRVPESSRAEMVLRNGANITGNWNVIRQPQIARPSSDKRVSADSPNMVYLRSVSDPGTMLGVHSKVEKNVRQTIMTVQRDVPNGVDQLQAKYVRPVPASTNGTPPTSNPSPTASPASPLPASLAPSKMVP
jgi:hypothetical protein